MQAPVLEQLKAKMGDSVSIVKVDIDKNMELARRYNVQSVPTLMIFSGGKNVWRGVGLHQAGVLEEKLLEHAGA